MPAPPLWTPRLWITPLLAGHLDAWQTLLGDEAVRRALRDAVPEQRAWLDGERLASDARFAGGTLGIFLVWLRASGELVGFAGLRPAGEPPALELVFGIAPRFYRQGLATEACAAVIERAFALGLDEVRAAVDETNSAARRLLERLGFTPVAASDGQLGFVLSR